MATERRSILVQGRVHGVGFRAHVSGLATRLGLSGYVRNVAAGVDMEVEGDAAVLDDFVREMTARPPILARIDSVTQEKRECQNRSGFEVRPSEK
jgi:hydrogenase maturation protein HypF